MAKKLSIALIIVAFMVSVSGLYAESTSKPTTKSPESVKDRASRGMNNLLYGPTEVPKNIDETKTKGEAMDRCSQKTRGGVERGIARVFSGVWQLATFWYADPNAPSTAGNKSSVK